MQDGPIKFSGFVGHNEQASAPLLVNDVPREQVLRECIFYAGDSLLGFDFGAKSIQAEAEGNKMYSEFRVFMFREQSSFIKNKFGVDKLPFEIELEQISKQSHSDLIRRRQEAEMKSGENPSPSASCNNLDLETGDYTGWLGGSGYNTNSNAALTLAGTAYYNIDQSIYDCNDFQLITSAYGNDIVGNFPGKDPNGGNYSSRVGGAYINRAQGYGGCDAPSYHWSALYSNGEYVENSFAVNATNCLISYDYAVILNDGAHPNGQQPYFHVEIVNGSGTVLSSCTQYYVQAPAGAPPPGFSLSGTAIPTASGPVYYKSWTANSINLTPYIGQTVTARFTAAGCTQGGHFGYAYVDASCGPAQIVTSSLTPCQGTNATLTAPPVAGGSYLWTGPGIVGSNTSQTVIVNASGTYSVTVTPSQGPGCAYSLAVVVNFVNVTASASASSSVNCNGGNNGSASVSVSGGSPAYTYAWSPSGGNSSAASGLGAGNYTVLITDGNGCTNTATVSITQPAALSSSITSTVAGCTVANGTAGVTASGGTPNYSYVWTPGGQTTSTATGLSSGNYNVTITDANGCTRTQSVNVGIAASPTTSASATQATCGNANGTATASPSGGTPAYSYVWSPGGQTAQTATGLASGNYNVTVTDINGCTATANVTVNNANGPTATATTTGNVNCSGGTNGSATVSVSGGSPAYTYLWSNGQTTTNATGLAAGTYTVVVSDANNCTYTTTATITQPTLLASTITSVNVACNGGNTGSSTVTPSGGTPGYTYSWSNGQSTATATGLTQGSYTVTVTDNNGCTSTNTVSITEPPALTSTATQTNVLCNGTNTGSATVTPAGGTPSYTYAWSPAGGNGSTATGLGAGNYVVTITDANGCTSTQSISITQPAVLAATYTQTNVSCNSGNNGSATVNVTGGTTNYTYAWSPLGGNGATANNLAAGIYICTITDANGCTVAVPVTISQPSPLVLTSTQVNVLCNNATNGSATVNASGSVPPYTYAWSPAGGNGATANNLSAGTYQCLITDANGCTKTVSVTITQPPPVTISVTGSDSVCLGDNTVLNAATAGGTPPYTYVWNPGPSSGSSITVSPTTTSTYSVVMTDANGCLSVMQTFTVGVLPSPTALFDTLSSGGAFSSTYQFNDMSTGGTAWTWLFGDGSSSNQQSPVHNFPGAGTYTVTQIVYNQYGCPDTFLVVVVIDVGIIIPNVFTPDQNGTNDVWYIPNSGMKEFHVVIYDRWGAKVFETTADEIRWDGRSSAGKLLSDGTYYFVLHAVLKYGSEGKDYSTSGYVTLLTEKRK